LPGDRSKAATDQDNADYQDGPLAKPRQNPGHFSHHRANCIENLVTILPVFFALQQTRDRENRG
jgi:hypothetical protein